MSKTYTLDGYPTAARNLAIDKHQPAPAATPAPSYRVIEHNPVGLPPEPSKEMADAILANSDLAAVCWEE